MKEGIKKKQSWHFLQHFHKLTNLWLRIVIEVSILRGKHLMQTKSTGENSEKLLSEHKNDLRHFHASWDLQVSPENFQLLSKF